MDCFMDLRHCIWISGTVYGSQAWDMDTRHGIWTPGIWTPGMGYGHQAWDMGLRHGIWASGMGYGSQTQGWALAIPYSQLGTTLPYYPGYTVPPTHRTYMEHTALAHCAQRLGHSVKTAVSGSSTYRQSINPSVDQPVSRSTRQSINLS